MGAHQNIGSILSPSNFGDNETTVLSPNRALTPTEMHANIRNAAWHGINPGFIRGLNLLYFNPTTINLLPGTCLDSTGTKWLKNDQTRHLPINWLAHSGSPVDSTVWNNSGIWQADGFGNVKYAQISPTQKSLTSNVANLLIHPSLTATYFEVGQWVKVEIGDPIFDGTHKLTAVSTSSISYAKTNANISGTACAGVVYGLTRPGRWYYTVLIHREGFSAPDDYLLFSVPTRDWAYFTQWFASNAIGATHYRRLGVFFTIPPSTNQGTSILPFKQIGDFYKLYTYTLASANLPIVIRRAASWTLHNLTSDREVPPLSTFFVKESAETDVAVEIGVSQYGNEWQDSGLPATPSWASNSMSLANEGYYAAERGPDSVICFPQANIYSFSSGAGTTYLRPHGMILQRDNLL